MSTYSPPFSLQGLLGINQSQKLIYNKAWNDFTRIQIYNSNVSTLRSQNISNLSYYTFVTYAERESFIQGMYLHTQLYPTSNWNLVQEN